MLGTVFLLLYTLAKHFPWIAVGRQTRLSGSRSTRVSKALGAAGHGMSSQDGAQSLVPHPLLPLSTLLEVGKSIKRADGLCSGTSAPSSPICSGAGTPQIFQFGDGGARELFESLLPVSPEALQLELPFPRASSEAMQGAVWAVPHGLGALQPHSQLPLLVCL